MQVCKRRLIQQIVNLTNGHILNLKSGHKKYYIAESVLFIKEKCIIHNRRQEL